MTIRRDWLKRQVEIMVQALGAALGLQKKGAVQEAAAAIENAIQSAFGMNGRFALGLSLDDFLNLALRGEAAGAELLNSMAELFDAWAALLDGQGRKAEGAAARARAAALRERAKEAC